MLDKQGVKILDDLEDQDVINDRTIIDKVSGQFRGDVGKDNAKAAGGIGADAGGAYGMSKLASKIPGAKGYLLKLLLGGIGAAGSNKFINQQAIHGKSPEQVDNTEVGLSGGAEVLTSSV